MSNKSKITGQVPIKNFPTPIRPLRTPLKIDFLFLITYEILIVVVFGLPGTDYL